MQRISLPSHEEVLNFVESSNEFKEKLLQLGRITLEERIEVALKVECALGKEDFYVSELGRGNEYSAHPGKSTCTYDWSKRFIVFSLHSHLDKLGKPKAAIFSDDDLFTYLATNGHNVSRISEAVSVPINDLFDQFGSNLLHQEGIVKATGDAVGLLVYQPPVDVIRPLKDGGYDLAKINNHYVALIRLIGRGNLDDQLLVVNGLREMGYVVTYIKFGADRKGTIVDRL